MAKMAWRAFNESPEVYCAVGDSPAQALKQMAHILKQNGVSWWSSSRLDVDLESGEFVITIYI